MHPWFTITNILLSLLVVMNGVIIPVLITLVKDKEHLDLVWQDYKLRHNIPDVKKD